MDDECEFKTGCTIRRRAELVGIARYPKRRGELAELIFTLKAASLGLVVSKPFGDSFPYDLVVEGGGRLARVQVKSVFTSNRPGYFINLGARGHAGGHRIYTPDEIDFLAAYIFAHDAWYIIPIAAIGTATSLRLYPVPSKKKAAGRFEQYRGAWSLLTGESQLT